MSEQDLRDLLEYWQKVLRLQDWNLKISFQHTSPLWSDHGESHVYPKFKSAEIWIRHPEDYADGVPQKEEIEETVVHELMHIMMHQMYYDPKNSPNEESGIECLAQAFCKLNRGLRPE